MLDYVGAFGIALAVLFLLYFLLYFAGDSKNKWDWYTLLAVIVLMTAGDVFAGYNVMSGLLDIDIENWGTLIVVGMVLKVTQLLVNVYGLVRLYTKRLNKLKKEASYGRTGKRP